MEHNCVTRSPTPRFVPSCWRYSAVSIRSVDAGDDSKKSRVTLLRWKSIGGSETVLQTLDAVLGIHVTGALHWPNVIVLDGGQFSARCRFCRSISSPSPALAEVHGKAEQHVCPGKSVSLARGATALWAWATPIRRSGNLGRRARRRG
jgi:hypothetical protein